MSGVDYAQLRAIISIAQVLHLAQFESVERSGDQARGPCPIHGSASPDSRSLSANLRKNTFRCFKCGAQGNPLDLWMAILELQPAGRVWNMWQSIAISLNGAAITFAALSVTVQLNGWPAAESEGAMVMLALVTTLGGVYAASKCGEVSSAASRGVLSGILRMFVGGATLTCALAAISAGTVVQSHLPSAGTPVDAYPVMSKVPPYYLNNHGSITEVSRNAFVIEAVGGLVVWHAVIISAACGGLHVALWGVLPWPLHWVRRKVK